MAKTKDHLTMRPISFWQGARWKERSGRELRVGQDWSHDKTLKRINLVIEAKHNVTGIESIGLTVEQARQLGQWLIAATYQSKAET
jgi:hypothetical protein